MPAAVIRRVLDDPSILARIFCYPEFMDLSAFQTVCKSWWAAIARRVRLVTLRVLRRWFSDPGVLLEAIKNHHAAVSGTAALQVARVLGMFQQPLTGLLRFRDDRVGERDRVTIFVPDSDSAEEVSANPKGARVTLTCIPTLR